MNLSNVCHIGGPRGSSKVYLATEGLDAVDPSRSISRYRGFARREPRGSPNVNLTDVDLS